MPFPWTLLPIALSALLFSWVFTWYQSAASVARATHTHFALAQIADLLNQQDSSGIPKDPHALVDLLAKAPIDWNDCKLRGMQIEDAWGRMIECTYDEKRMMWNFRSLGKDGQRGTNDDIQASTVERKTGSAL